MSLSAAESGYYGFSIEYSKADYSRRAKSTRFASYKMNTSEWWLRTNPSGSRLLYYVDEIGKINSKWPDNNLGVRPALHISPNSPYISYAGTVASDGTVYEVDPPGSQKYTVTFDSNGGTSVSSQKVKSGGLVSKPSNPTKSGYTFDGWYSDSALTNKWNFSTDVVTYNMTLYAKWIENTVETYYTVTFDSNGGSLVSSQTVKSGGLVSKPSNPTKSGYTFDGWYSNSSLTNKWNFNTDVVTYNMTLYAKWIENSVETYYTVTFNSNGGTSVSSQKVKKGELVSKPSSPTRSGYTFDGWYSDSALTDKWDFAADVVTSITFSN